MLEPYALCDSWQCPFISGAKEATHMPSLKTLVGRSICWKSHSGSETRKLLRNRGKYFPQWGVIDEICLPLSPPNIWLLTISLVNISATLADSVVRLVWHIQLQIDDPSGLDIESRKLQFRHTIPKVNVCSCWWVARVDMSKALHFAYTSHGKTLTKTLLTYTLTWLKCNFFYQENITKSWL